jgi:hypothetical protein
VVGGWHDSDLTPRGLRDAEAIAQTLGHEPSSLGAVITAWIKVPLTNLGYASFPAKPGSITTLIEDDRFHNTQVVTLADTRHRT